MGWLRRLHATLAPGRQRGAIDEEVRFHVEQRIEDLVREGMAEDDARREARRRFGSPLLTRDRAADADSYPWLADAVQDAKHGLRVLRQHPSFAAGALLTLALGIGATSAVFTVVYGVLVRPLPYPSADRLVRVWEEHPGGTAGAGNRWISNRTYWAWAERPRTVDALGAYGGVDATIRIGDDDVRLSGAEISPALLPALGATPRIGRLLDAADADEAGEPVVLIGEAVWRDRFGSDPGVIGRGVRLDGLPHRVVGVLPAAFAFPDAQTRFWRPYRIARVSADPEHAQLTSAMTVLARLAPGVSAAQAEAEGTAMARSVPVTMATQALFGVGKPPVVHVRTLAADLTRGIRPILLVLSGAVGCVLLIACANVANLYLTRGLGRRREFAVRAAIGAGRSRLVRQLLTELLVLSSAGAVLGLAFAWALLRLALALAPAGFPRLTDIRLDWPVLVCTGAATVLTGLLSGLLPALQGARLDVAASLRGGSGAAGEGTHARRDRRWRDGLLVAEAAFAVLLIVGALLLIRSFVRLTTVDAGYTAEGVLTARILMPPGSAVDRADRFAEAVLPRLRALPGVVSAGAGNMMPMLPVHALTTFPLPDPSGASPETMARAVAYTVTPGYAEALGLRLRAGRMFDERDVQGGTRPMIVNDVFARRYLRGGDVVGRRFSNLFRRTDRNVVTEIVGVVAPMLKDGNDREPEPEVYFVASAQRAQHFFRGVNFVVRTTDGPAALADAVRAAVRDADRDAIVDRLQPLTQPLAASVAEPRFATATLVLFAALALALASVGLFSVLSHAVSQRGRELGVRVALGASRSRLLGLVLREGLTVTVAGVALGMAGAAAATRLMQGALFGVTPLDPVSFAIAPLVLLPVACAAALGPALRAARVAPAEALRE